MAGAVPPIVTRTPVKTSGFSAIQLPHNATMAEALTNWSANLTFSAREVLHRSSVDEVRSALRDHLFDGVVVGLGTLADFRKLARSFEPGGKFRNRFLDTFVLG